MNIDDIIENAQLKGRVIALEAELESEKAAMKALMTNPTSRLLRAEREENARLKAELERLRKAGTEMGKHLLDTDEANRAYIDFEAGGRQS